MSLVIALAITFNTMAVTQNYLQESATCSSLPLSLRLLRKEIVVQHIKVRRTP